MHAHLTPFWLHRQCVNMLLAYLGEPHLAKHETISEEQRNVTAAAALSIERFQMPTSTDDLAGLAMDKEVDETFHVSQMVCSFITVSSVFKLFNTTLMFGSPP